MFGGSLPVLSLSARPCGLLVPAWCFFGGSLPVLSLSAPFLRFAAGICLVGFLAVLCLYFLFRLRACGLLLVPAWSFRRFSVCTFSFGSVLAGCCWYLLGSSFLAVLCLYFLFRLRTCGLLLVPASWFLFSGSLPVLSLSAPFLRCAAGTC